MKQIIDELRQADIGKVWTDEPLANHTTWRIGGPADLLIQPKDKSALLTALKIIHRHDIPWSVIGARLQPSGEGRRDTRSRAQGG